MPVLNIPRIIFVNRYYHPDSSATSQLLAELVTSICRDQVISVVTSRQLSGDSSVKLTGNEWIDGVRVVRLWTTRFGRSSLWRRSLDYLSFYCAVLLYLLWRVSRDDIVVLKTDPPLLQLVNTSVIKMKRGKVINWLQDLYPEIAVRLGKFPGPSGLAYGIATWRDRALRAASVNVVVSASMARYLGNRGVINTQVIPNWADEKEITPIDHRENPLRADWGLQRRFTVMYSGNFGRAHTFSEIAGAVGLLASEVDIQFVFVGEGAGLDQLKERLGRTRSENFVFKPFQPKSALRYSLGAADLHLVTLRPGMEDLLMPSKVYGILAAGRAVGLVGDTAGDIAHMISRENLGFVVANGDAKGLAEAILRFKSIPEVRARQQENARAIFEAEYTHTLAVDRWQRLLDAKEQALKS